MNLKKNIFSLYKHQIQLFNFVLCATLKISLKPSNKAKERFSRFFKIIFEFSGLLYYYFHSNISIFNLLFFFK